MSQSECMSLQIGMIGCGGIARWHMSQLLKNPSVEIVALADPDSSQIERSVREYPALAGLPVYADFEDMLDKIALDAVEISTPHTQHIGQMQKCFAKGLHVLCEKPLVTSVEDAKRAIAARDQSGKVGLLAYQRHTQPEFRAIRDKIASGDFGAVQFVSAMQAQEWKRLTKGLWRQDPALSGGGQLNDSGSHLIDILLWTTGLRAETVAAVTDNRGTAVDINAAINLRFAGGAMGNISIVGDGHGWHEDVTIWCERGTFLVRNGKLSTVDEAGNKWSADQLVGGSNPDTNFVNAILGTEEVQSTFEDGLKVIELTEAAWSSAARGGATVVI